jgi:hypothetical protein
MGGSIAERLALDETEEALIVAEKTSSSLGSAQWMSSMTAISGRSCERLEQLARRTRDLFRRTSGRAESDRADEAVGAIWSLLAADRLGYAVARIAAELGPAGPAEAEAVRILPNTRADRHGPSLGLRPPEPKRIRGPIIRLG